MDTAPQPATGAEGYCNAAMDTGVIPPVPNGSSLLQVHVLIRHGARVLATGAHPCWAGDDAVYHCDGTGPAVRKSGGILFRDSFDLGAGTNKLPGNCGLGALVKSGVEMQRASGASLREAYGTWLPPAVAGHESAFRLRSDESERTIASGQALFAGMYPGEASAPPTLPWHLMDKQYKDAIIAVGSPALCPALHDAWISASRAAAASLVVERASLDAEVRAATGGYGLVDFVGVPSYINMFDCIMSHECPTVPSTGGAPPAAFNASLRARVVRDAVQHAWRTMNDTTVARCETHPRLPSSPQA